MYIIMFTCKFVKFCPIQNREVENAFFLKKKKSRKGVAVNLSVYHYLFFELGKVQKKSKQC